MKPALRRRTAFAGLVFAAAFAAGMFWPQPPRAEAPPEVPSSEKSPAVRPAADRNLSPAPSRRGKAPDELAEDFAAHFKTREGEVFSGEELDRLYAAERYAAEDYAARWAARDPRGMLKWLLSGLAPERDFMIHRLFGVWAGRDAPAALAAAESLPGFPPERRRQAFGAILATLSVTDPARAAALAERHAGFLAEASVSKPAFPENLRDPAPLWRVLAALPDGAARDKLLAGLLSAESLARPGAVETLWREAPRELRLAVARGGFWPGSSERIPEGFPALLLEHAEQSGDRTALGAGLVLGVRENPAFLGEAAARAREAFTGNYGTGVVLQMIEEGARRDFRGTLAWWEALPGDLLKVRAAGLLEKIAPPELRPVLTEAIAAMPPGDARRARQGR